MFHYAAIIVLGFWCANEKAFARTQPSQESSAAGRLGGVVQDYIIRHHGVWPTNWAPLASGLLQKNAQLVANGKMPFEGTYVFVPTNFPPLDRPDGRVILARSDSIEEGGLRGRYVVYQDTAMIPDQFCTETWVNEKDFQALLVAFGGKLQEPDSNALRIAQAAVASMFAEDPDLKRRLVSLPPSEVFAVVAILGGIVVAIIVGWKIGNRRPRQNKLLES
jgi:hypothetical protein